MPTITDFENTAKSFKGGFPVMLLPVRLETRFRTKADGKKELCIRVFPDEIAINQLNPDLSAEERAAGKQFWAAAKAAGDTEQARLEGFRALALKLGATRAAFVAGRTNPSNALDPINMTSWAGPSSLVMPDYFVFWAYRTETDATPLTMVGANIPKPLPTGLNPTKLADGASPLPAWMTDFDAAVSAGMAVAQVIGPAEAQSGFHKIIALGLCAAASPQASMNKLNSLLNVHRQSVGVEVLLPGSPTNNTAEAPSAFRSNADADAVWASEYGKEQYTTATDPFQIADGQLLTSAFGFPQPLFKRVPGAGNFSRRNATAMNTALWPATFGFYLEEMLSFFKDGKHLFNKKDPNAGDTDDFSNFDITPTLDKVRELFTRYIKGRGALPTIRVGKQPYGILPVGPVLSPAWRDASAEEFEKNLLKILDGFHTEWKAITADKNKLPTVDDLGTAAPESNFMKILGQHAVSPSFFVRYAMSVESMRDTDWPSYQTWLNFGKQFQDYFFKPPTGFAWPWPAPVDDPKTTQVDESKIDNPNTPQNEKEITGGSNVKLSGLFFKKEAAPLGLVDGGGNPKAPYLVDTLPVKDTRQLPRQSVPVSELGAIQQLVWRNLNYIEWLSLPNLNFDTLHKGMTKNQHPLPNTSNVLLYVLLRSAAFHQHWDAVMRVYEAAGVREGFFNNLTEAEWISLGGTNFQKMLLNPYVFIGKTLNQISQTLGWDPYTIVNSIVNNKQNWDKPLTKQDIDQIWILPPVVRANYKNGIIGLTDLVKSWHYGILNAGGSGLSVRGEDPSYLSYLLEANYLLRARGRFPYFFFKFRPDGPLPGIASGERTGIQYIQDANLGRKNFPAATAPLAEWQASMAAIANLPTAELERLLAEHIDLCSHRLDAWYLGLVNKRFAAARAQNPVGLYLGAFGYVENIKPDTARQNTSHGFVHAPSIDQAVTAAVLRSAYKNTGAANERMAVKLSSSRVRLSLELLDGLRGGRSLAALLAKRFERELSERGLMSFWGDIMGKGIKVGEPGGTEVPDVLGIVNEFRGIASTVPSNLKAWVKNLFITPAFNEVVKTMDDLLDAVGDLMLSESVYHLVRGDYNRAAASLEALTEGARPPEPEFVRTPRAGTALTHRVGVSFAPITNNAAPPGWPSKLTPRALAEPSLNHWLGVLLGPPTAYTCVAFANQRSTTAIPLVLNDLNLQPLDWLSLFRGEWAAPESQLCRLLHRAAVEKDGRSLALSGWTFDFQTPSNPAAKSFRRLAAWCARFAQLFGQCRPLTAQDWAHPAATAPANAPGGTDLAQLRGRLQQVKAGLSSCREELEARTNAMRISLKIGGGLGGTLGGLSKIGSYANLLDALKKAALWGVPEAVHPPVPIIFSSDGDANVLIAAAQPASERLKKIDQALDAVWPASFPPDMAPEALLETCLKAARAVFGNAFLVVPVFKPIDGGLEVKNALASNPVFLPNRPLVVEDWLVGAARVRGALSGFESALNAQSAIAQTANADWKLTPFQLPVRANDRWVGAELPVDYFEKHADNETRDKLSLVFWLPADAATRTDFAGFVADEWSEVIPAKTQTTGIALHYNQPNARAPQTILLAVHPSAHDNKVTPFWTTEYLQQSVDTAIKLAKIRAVDPTHLSKEKSMFTHLLPALIGRVTDPSELSVDSKSQAAEWDFSTDFGVVNSPVAEGFFPPLPSDGGNTGGNTGGATGGVGKQN